MDGSELIRIVDFLRRRGALLRANWDRIGAAVERQLGGPYAPMATRADALLRRYTTPIDESARRATDEMTLGSPLVFFIGAGGSAGSPTSIPTIQKLLPMLWRKVDEIGS